MNVTFDPLALLGLLFAIGIIWGLYAVHRSKSYTYDLSDLVTTGGHYDLSKVGQLLALLSSTWVFIHMELRAATVEWYAGLYMLAWVGAGFGSLYARIKGNAPRDVAPAAQPTAGDEPRPPRGGL